MDDLKLSKCLDEDKSKSDSYSGPLQININLLHARTRYWGLIFSVNKCVRLNFNQKRYGPSISFYFLGQDPIPNMSCYKDLGVTMDVFLKFHFHVRDIYGKASGVA